MTVREHILENAVIIDRLNERVDTVCHRFEFLRQLRNSSVLNILTVLVRHRALHIHIAVLNKVELNGIGFLIVDKRRYIVHLDIFALEVFACSHRGSVIKHGLNIRLQVRHKGLIAFTGNYRQRVDLVNAVAAALHIHPVAVLIDAKAQTTTDFLPLRRVAVGVLQSTDLEHIWVVPALTQCGVGEDEPCWLVKGQQPFLVFQNQVIGGNIVGELAATLELTVHAAPGFLIDAEIALMHPAYIAASGFEILLIRRVKHRNVLVQNGKILLLKHHAIFAKHLVAVFIILAVLCHFVDEEQGQALDAHVKELFLFLKVGEDSFPNLNAAHILFGHIANHIAGFDDFAVGKGHSATQRVNFRDGIPLVLLHFLRNKVEVVPNAENTGFPVDGFVVADLQLDFRHRRLLAGKNDLLKVEVAVRATEVLDLKALDLDLLDQPLVEGVQRIQHIDEVVMLGVGSRVVEGEQRIEVLQCLLRHIAAHLLRLVQNNDRTVRLDNIDRSAGTELIPFGVDDAGFLTLAVLFQRGGKRLRVDDHHIDAGAA